MVGAATCAAGCDNRSVSTSAADPVRSLAVVVVNYGTHALVEANLTRSLGQGFAGSVVVVDNFSDAEERQAVASMCARKGWDCVPLGVNTGFGGGVNRGVQVAIALGASELLVLNPDAWLELDGIRRLQARVRVDPMLLVAPRVVRPTGRLYSDENDLYLDTGELLWRELRKPGTSPDRVHTWVSGACFVMSTELWSRCGGFDEDYFLYWEDIDLSYRVVSAGGIVHVDSSVTAVHDEGSSQRAVSTPSRKSPTYYYYNARNRLVYAAKHVGAADRRHWLRATPRVAYGLAKQGGRRQLLHPRRTLWPAVRGAWDGARYLRRATAEG